MIKISNIIKCILVVLILFNIIILDTRTAYALSDVTANPDLWLQEDKDVGQKKLNEKARPILSVIRIFGIVVSVITFAIIGFKIMFSSLEEKAAYKQTMMPWLLGATMLFTMSTVPGIIYDIVKGSNSNEGQDIIPLNTTEPKVLCIGGCYMSKNPDTGYYECAYAYTPYMCGCQNQIHRIENTSDTKEYCINRKIMDTSVYPYKCKDSECGCENRWGYSAWTCRFCNKQLSEINGQYQCQWCGRLYGF